MTKLLDDIARCRGVGSDEEGWRDGCESCIRRLSDRDGMTWHMEPPAIIVFECEYLIEKEQKCPT